MVTRLNEDAAREAHVNYLSKLKKKVESERRLLKREVKRQAKLEQQQLKKKRFDHPNQTPEEALGHGSTFGKEVSQKPDNDTRTEKSDDIVEKDGISSLTMKEQESKDLQSGMEIGLHQT